MLYIALSSIVLYSKAYVLANSFWSGYSLCIGLSIYLSRIAHNRIAKKKKKKKNEEYTAPNSMAIKNTANLKQELQTNYAYLHVFATIVNEGKKRIEYFNVGTI